MQNILGPTLGFLPPSPANGTTTLAISAANTWIAFSFLGNGKQLSKVRLFASASAGTLTAAQLTCDIYSSTAAGLPNASVNGPTNCDAVPASGWNSWSPAYTTADGTMYHVVIKNTHGTPASNNLTFRYGGTDTGLPFRAGPQWGWNKSHTTDGSAWGTVILGTCSLQLDWSDSTYDGNPFSQVAASGSSEGVFGTAELGTMWAFTGPTVNVRAIIGYTRVVTGTPSQALRARIYSGSSSTPTLVVTSSGGPSQSSISSGYMLFPLASVQALAAGTYRTTLGTTGADTSANRYNSQLYTIQNLASSKGLMPFGNAKRTYTSDGTTFAETDTEIVPIGWLLDNGAEFTVSSSGGGAIWGGRLIR